MAKEAQEEIVAVETPAPAARSKKAMMMIGVFAGIMLLEGVGVFVVAKRFAGPPASAQASTGEGLDAAAGKKAPKDIEVEVVRVRAQNEKSQQMLVYDITVAAVFEEKKVNEEKKEEGKEEKEEKDAKAPKETSKIAEFLQSKKATLQDRFGRVVRSLDPQRFSEPDLATLREQFKHELMQIVGEEAIVKEVLIPSMTRSTEN